MKLSRAVAALLVPLAALAVCSAAWAHAHISPPVARSGESQVFTVAVPNEKEDANTTRIELTPPEGFSIGSFLPAPGWQRQVQATGTGEDAVIEKVTWSGGEVPPGEATNFQFLGNADSDQDYALSVRQTYSDGEVVDWSGPESSDTPAPTIEAKSSLGGGGGFPFLALVALILAVVALLVAIGGLLMRPGGRALA
jgi:uncharacterized protein YcnI